MQLVADGVQSVVIGDTGHFVAEEALEEMLTALTPFLAPYRGGQPSRTARGRSPPREVTGDPVGNGGVSSTTRSITLL